MRFSILFLIFLSLPALYLGYLDWQKSRINNTPFEISTIGQVWIAHDRASFEDFKESFQDPKLTFSQQEENWNKKAKIYLEIKTFPAILALPGVYVFWLFVAFLAGVGPFRAIRSENNNHQDEIKSDYARLSQRNRGSGRIRYTRK